jgi:hypothetical protein
VGSPADGGAGALLAEAAVSADDSDAAGDAEGPDAFAACPETRPTTGAFPDDVAAVLAGKCQTCHQSPTKNHAPFPLLTYAETQSSDPLSPYTGVPIWQVMHTVIQTKGVPHMPFGNAPQLTATEMQTLDGWLLACALPVVDDGGLDASSQDAGVDAAAATDAALDAGGNDSVESGPGADQ